MDELHKFLFEGLPVRGMIVRLTHSWREVLALRQGADAYPPPVRALLGEMAVAGVLMQANIQFNGTLILQVFGDGPVKLAVTEVQSNLGFRATAKVVGEVADDARLPDMLNRRGRGRCGLTLDPLGRAPGQQPYQSIVSLVDAQREPLQRVSEVLEHYMLQSAQLDTKLVLAADDDVAAGLLIQRLPIEGEGNLGARRQDDPDVNDAYNRIQHLVSTLTASELLSLEPQAVLHRLFWEEPLRCFTPQQPRFACSCSRERVGQMLRGLGRDEIDSIVAERDCVEIGCDFCGAQYRFDAIDVGELFTPERDQPPVSNTVH